MEKKSIALILVASSIASSAFATSFIDKITTKHHAAKSAVTKTHATTRHADSSYTDFSGNWTGDCGNGGFETNIENNAYYIAFDDINYNIGKGLQGNYESNEYQVSQENTSFEWSADGSALTMKEISFNKDNTDRSAIQADLSTFTLTKKNDQINLDGKFSYFEDLLQNEVSRDIHCVMTKKQ